MFFRSAAKPVTICFPGKSLLLLKECDRQMTTLIFVSHDSSLEKLFDRTIRLADINRVGQSTGIKD